MSNLLDRVEVVWEGFYGEHYGQHGRGETRARVVVRFMPSTCASPHILYVEQCLSDALGAPKWSELTGEPREWALARAVVEMHESTKRRAE